MVFHDVSHTRTLARQLSWQASHDALTQLFNRREFETRLEQAAQEAQGQAQPHMLCFLDLDRFKVVNDTCGHAAGDQLLKQVAALLQAQIRKTDVLARLGGDEFGVLLHQCPLSHALEIADRIRESVQQFRFVWEGQVFSIGVSIGVVSIGADANVASLLSAADAACYAAKHKGRNRVHLYQVDDSDLVRQRGELQWVTCLAQAIESDQFCLYCQPIVPIATPQADWKHYEVLLRRDDQNQLILPRAFLPAAERYGLMHLIDRWVIRTLFAAQGSRYREIRRHCQGQTCHYRDLFAINLSGASINDDQFVEFVQEQFLLHQIPPQIICFEITETVAIANLNKAAQLVGHLRDFGCRFALDDFGNGLSSFAYLKHLPVDYLKIDGEFVRQVTDNPIDAVMVEAMHQIGQVMGIQTIAEFVENDRILERLRSIGVDFVQGYGIAEPRPLFLPNSA